MFCKNRPYHKGMSLQKRPHNFKDSLCSLDYKSNPDLYTVFPLSLSLPAPLPPIYPRRETLALGVEASIDEAILETHDFLRSRHQRCFVKGVYNLPIALQPSHAFVHKAVLLAHFLQPTLYLGEIVSRYSRENMVHHLPLEATIKPIVARSAVDIHGGEELLS
mmetsp:Transcript_65470/g.95917  ORF Transcript_65470/g.95917 Transcript_65470/m.95917 type:complete len:163 (+) Transcript_65470:188-676(+)